VKRLPVGRTALAAAALSLSTLGLAVTATPAHADPATATLAAAGSDTTEALMAQYLAQLPGLPTTFRRTQTATAGTNIPAVPGAAGFNVTVGTPGTDPGTNPFDANADGVVKWGNATNNQERLAPNGSSAGITELVNEAAAGQNAVDIARSSRGPRATDPATLVFHDYALDAIWPVTPGWYAPATLTKGQVQDIYLGPDRDPATPDQFTNWNQVGGANYPITAFLPQTGSGSRNEFITRWLGLAADPGTGGFAAVPAANQTIEENSGKAAALVASDLPGTILPYSMGKWVRQGNNFNNASIDNRNGVHPILLNDAGTAVSPVVRAAGSWSLNGAVVTEANADNITAAVPGVRLLYNVTATNSPQFTDAQALVGLGTSICNGPTGAANGLIRGQGFIPHNCRA
jgi:phosphate transport system substrate-binding protein